MANSENINAAVIHNLPKGFGSIFGIKLPFVIYPRKFEELAVGLIAHLAIDLAIAEKQVKSARVLEEYASAIGIRSISRRREDIEDDNGEVTDHECIYKVEFDMNVFVEKATEIIASANETLVDQIANAAEESDECEGCDDEGESEVHEEVRGGWPGEVLKEKVYGTKDFEV